MAEETKFDPEEQARQEELDRLEKEILAAAEPKTEEVETPVEAPVDKVPGDDDEGLFDAATTVFSRMDDAKRREVLQKKFGYDLTPKEEAKAAKEDVALGAKRKTAEEMLNEILSGIPQGVLPEGFDDLEPAHQALVAAEIRADMKAHAAQEAALAPYKQQEAEQARVKTIEGTSDQWANQLGVPEVKGEIAKYLSGFNQQHFDLYMQEDQAGGGPFMESVHTKVRQIADEFQRQKEAAVEKPLPKSEESGGKESKEEANIPQEAMGLIENMRRSGKFSEEEVSQARAEIAKELSYK